MFLARLISPFKKAFDLYKRIVFYLVQNSREEFHNLIYCKLYLFFYSLVYLFINSIQEISGFRIVLINFLPNMIFGFLLGELTRTVLKLFFINKGVCKFLIISIVGWVASYACFFSMLFNDAINLKWILSSLCLGVPAYLLLYLALKSSQVPNK